MMFAFKVPMSIPLLSSISEQEELICPLQHSTIDQAVFQSCGHNNTHNLTNTKYVNINCVTLMCCCLSTSCHVFFVKRSLNNI